MLDKLIFFHTNTFAGHNADDIAETVLMNGKPIHWCNFLILPFPILLITIRVYYSLKTIENLTSLFSAF